MGETDISWTHRPGTVGRSWNPGEGCSMVSPGCTNCYAMRIANRFARDGWSNGLVNIKNGKWNGVVRLRPHKLADPLRWRKPSTVFVNSMTDLFHDGYTNDQIAAVFGVMAAAPQHTFQVLTKRAKRMREWFAWTCGMNGVNLTTGAITRMATDPLASIQIHASRHGVKFAPRSVQDAPSWPLRNVWIGVSVENQEAADERIPELLATPAAVRFLSCEPLLSHVDLRHVHHDHLTEIDSLTGDHGVNRPLAGRSEIRIDWVISGCESGPGARPCDVAWLRSLRDQCAAAGVPYFLKQATSTREFCDECREPVMYRTISGQNAIASCGCTIEGGEVCSPVGVMEGDNSKRKAGGVIELPYLDGVQHAAFPSVTPEPR